MKWRSLLLMRGMTSTGKLQPDTDDRRKSIHSERTTWFLAWLAFLPLVMIRAENFAESDTFWEIRTGILTIDQGTIPIRDTFSWTVAGEPWTLNSWGFNVVLGAAHRLGGLTGSAIAASVLVAFFGALLLLLARQLGATPVISGWVLFIGGALMTTWISARPQIVDYIAMLGVVLLLNRLRITSRPVWVLAGFGLLTIAWVNLHAAASLGAVSCGAAAVAMLISRRDRRLTIRFVGATLVVGGCSLINPYGFGILAQAIQVKDESTNIREWQSFDASDPLQLMVMAAGLTSFVIAARRRDPILVAVLAVMVCGSIAAYRILPILFLLSLPILAAAAPPPVLRYFESRRRMLRQGAIVSVVVAVIAAGINIPNLGRPDPAHFPSLAIQEIPVGCQLFNDYQLGGLVILQRPDVKVSIDSRNDLYGAQRVDRSLKAIEGNGDYERELQGADCALIPPDTELARILRDSPQWLRTFNEPTAELFVRVS